MSDSFFYCLNLTNPYWVAVACIAVMEGSSTRHIFQRSVQRIIGTLIGVVFGWEILLFVKNLWEI
ncbi:FUSC family protein [Leptotrichia trevisanii]